MIPSLDPEEKEYVKLGQNWGDFNRKRWNQGGGLFDKIGQRDIGGGNKGLNKQQTGKNEANLYTFGGLENLKGCSRLWDLLIY